MKNQVMPQQFPELSLSQLQNTTGGNNWSSLDIIDRLFSRKK